MVDAENVRASNVSHKTGTKEWNWQVPGIVLEVSKRGSSWTLTSSYSVLVQYSKMIPWILLSDAHSNCWSAVIMCWSYGRCRLAWVARRFTVPPYTITCSFTVGRCTEVPFTLNTKIFLMITQVKKVFLVFVLRCSTIWKVNDPLGWNVENSLEKTDQFFLKEIHCYCIVMKAVWYNHIAEMLFLFWLLEVYDKWVNGGLRIVPMKALRCILENKWVVFWKICLYKHLTRFQSGFWLIKERSLLNCNERVGN